MTIVTGDHNILIYTYDAEEKKFECEKKMSGYNDEILDVILMDENRRLLVANNSELVSSFELSVGDLRDRSNSMIWKHSIVPFWKAIPIWFSV